MINHRPRVELPRFDNTSDEQPDAMTDGQSPFPAWNRERLVRHFEEIDGSIGGDAELRVDAFERSFRDVFPASVPRHELPGDSTE